MQVVDAEKPVLTKEQKQAILAQNASPQTILERIWFAQRRGITHSSVKAIAGFGTTQARAHVTLLDLKERGLVFHELGKGWHITECGVKYLSQLWQEVIDRERAERAAKFEGWTQGELFEIPQPVTIQEG